MFEIYNAELTCNKAGRLWLSDEEGYKVYHEMKKELFLKWHNSLISFGVPKGIRTPAAGVKGRCPGPD